MGQDDIKALMDAASAGGSQAIHKRLVQILVGIEGIDRRLKLAELSAELAGESVDIFRFSDRAMVASVIRECREIKNVVSRT